MRSVLLCLGILVLSPALRGQSTPATPPVKPGPPSVPVPDWKTAAAKNPPMTGVEARGFMKTLTRFVLEHHLKKDASSPQRGLIYEYWWVKQKRWIQGEALDTMHDGAWFAAAMVNAWRATGDSFYLNVLKEWQLPFYLKMLNHSDELFTDERNDAAPQKQKIWSEAKEWRLQGREKGFVPYWWDDGASMSLERTQAKTTAAFFPCRDELSGQPNTEYRLSGYSLGSSNHLAQDLGVMLQQCWSVFHDRDPALAAQIAQAAVNLQECRARHGAASIPAVVAAWSVTSRDAKAAALLPKEDWLAVLTRRNHYLRAFFDFQPGKKESTPGFADDQQYRYYASVARNGTLTEPMAFSVIYDAFTEPKAFNRYYDNARRPPGINRFDLSPLNVINGKLEHRRSEGKGPKGGPAPVGSRLGPQNMVCSAWALQALRSYPEVWAHARAEAALAAKPVPHLNAAPETNVEDVKQALEYEVGGGLRTWEAVFKQYGYIPTGIGCQSALPGVPWDEFSDAGGYAHLISAAAQWMLYLRGRNDWDVPKP